MKRRNFLLATLAAAPAAALANSVPRFLAGSADERTARSFSVAAGQSRFQEKTLVGNNPNDIKISSKDTGGELTVFEYTGLAKGGPSLHMHLYQDETFYVLAGEYLFVVGEEQRKLKPGDTIFLPRQIPHTWTQLTTTGKLLYFMNPSGKMEEFFRARPTGQTAPTPQEKEQFYLAHGMKWLGPPLPVKS
ncbi:cupin domain-containing protein [Hymenobacter koreensis]